ncbi:MAG: tRNA (adenosine(37)-N6)-threonylcarbamoyltransferase complex ATPase subunit type 1 TsaE [Bacteroidota bacterium]|nr:tRNA (adenosine(37)-N6)-threonylcarbamoyltransferase complex ATPase subunit type 1 TsaE [Bacteroidota bacterium]
MELEARENELDLLVNVLVDKITSNTLVLLSGDVGAGKTTLIKAICRSLGVTENISSPTFGLVHSYQSKLGEIFHSDWYRIESTEELYEAGIEEGLDTGIWFIEWPELGKEVLVNRDYIHIKISGTDERRRYRMD